MVDLSQTIIPKSDQLNSEDLLSGPRVITITGVKQTAGDQPISVHYEGDNGKPWKPCKTMRKLLVHAWGKNGMDYVGRSVELYLDPTVKWAGQEVGGVRVSRMSHIKPEQFPVALTETRGKKKPYIVKPLTVSEPVNQSVTPAELSVDEQVNRFAKEFGARLGKGPFSEFDNWWKKNEPVRKLFPDWRIEKIENALAEAIEGGWKDKQK